jgi:Ricin-type beta-trefoil lectin domain-like
MRTVTRRAGGLVIGLVCLMPTVLPLGTAPALADPLAASYESTSIGEDGLPGTYQERLDAWNSLDAAGRAIAMDVARDHGVAPVAAEAEQDTTPTPAPDPDETLPLPTATQASSAETSSASGRELVNPDVLADIRPPVLGFGAEADDGDRDALPDAFENQLIQSFMPEYHVSAGERSDVGMPRFADQSTLQPLGVGRQQPPLVHDQAVWATGTVGHPGAFAVFQLDGNFVVYSASGQPLWASGTVGVAIGGRLAFQDDGNLVIYTAAGYPVWDRHNGRLPIPPPPSQATLTAVHSGKCLDVAGGSLADGGTVHQWSCHGGANQQWRMTEVTQEQPPPPPPPPPPCDPPLLCEVT